ncbi:MAG TPA: 50S ribosomal protein L21 [Ignavibacteriaceae bacterium]|nr:50S ribosomal protein L21 [Ignavibacteriaceae bacterium]
MYAIVEIAGQQFKVEKNQEIFVHQLEGEKDTAVSFENVLLLDNEGTVTVGAPVVNGAVIQAKILDHVRGDKVIVFHKKRRKGYQKQNGHRQYFSKILIEDILTDGKKAASSKKKKAVIENPVETTSTEVEIKSEN